MYADLNYESQLFRQFKADQEQIARDAGGINHDVYEKRLTDPNADKWPKFRLTPHSMYFYYVRINMDGRLVVDHYFYVDGDRYDPKTWKPIPYDEQGLTELVTKLAINARPSVQVADKNPRRDASGDFGKIPWRHISYIAIYFDEANWTLRKQAAGSGESAVTFVVREGNKVGSPNQSFFDAIDLPITMPIRRPKRGGPTEDERSAIVFVNHMKADEDGNDLGPKDNQKFVFKMILDVASASDDPPTVIIIDPGGENGGPSVPPPPA